MWGPVNLLRQTNNFSGLSSKAQFDISGDPSIQYDYVFVPNEHKLLDAMAFPQEKRLHVCMENPDIWSPSFEFLSNIGYIFTPFPEALKGLSPVCKVFQSYPCVPWFYDAARKNV